MNGWTKHVILVLFAWPGTSRWKSERKHWRSQQQIFNNIKLSYFLLFLEEKLLFLETVRRDGREIKMVGEIRKCFFQSMCLICSFITQHMSSNKLISTITFCARVSVCVSACVLVVHFYIKCFPGRKSHWNPNWKEQTARDKESPFFSFTQSEDKAASFELSRGIYTGNPGLLFPLSLRLPSAGKWLQSLGILKAAMHLGDIRSGEICFYLVHQILDEENSRTLSDSSFSTV